MPERAPDTPAVPYEEFSSEREKLAALDQAEARSDFSSAIKRIRAATDDKSHPLYSLPEGATPALEQEQAQLQGLIRAATHPPEGVGDARIAADKIMLIESMVASFEARANAEAAATLAAITRDAGMKPYRAALRDAIGAGGTPEQFDEFMRWCASDIPAPRPRDGASKADVAKLEQSYRALRTAQYGLVDRVFNLSMLELQRREKFPEDGERPGLTDKEKKAVLKSMAIFVSRRTTYEGQLRKQPLEKPSVAFAILGTVVEELAEEGFESLHFGEPLVKPPAWLEQFDAATRAKIMEGYGGAANMIGKRCPALSNVLRTMEKSPLGSRFWKQLLTIESPVTVLLFMIHVHQSPNKLKATLDFASFLAASAVSGALLETTTALLVAGARVMAARRNMQGMRVFMYLARLPKHPGVQFAAAIAFAMGAAPVIDAITTWVDEKIPDGPGKRALNDGISVVSGSSIIESAEFLAGEVGLSQVDPEKDSLAYMSRELLTIEWEGGMQRRKMNGMLDWNAAVDRRIAAEWNPLAKRLYQFEKADGGKWADREAFRMFSLVQHGKSLQDAIAGQLVERGIIDVPARLDFLYWATDGEGAERPDHAVARIEDDASFPEGRVAAYVKGLASSPKPEDKTLVAQWKEYRSAIRDIASRTVTFRHLGVYDKKAWFGDKPGTKITDRVQRGIAAEITYRMDRDEILTRRVDAREARDEFARFLTSLTTLDAKKHDVVSVPFSSFFTEGFLIDPRSHFYKYNLIATAEAAAQYLPKDHDVNVLLAEIRDSVVHKRPLTERDMQLIRDALESAILRHQEATAVLAPARGAGGAFARPNTFLASDINKDFLKAYRDNTKREDDPSTGLLSYAFAKDVAAQEGADVHVFQAVIPGYRTGAVPSKYEGATLAYTAIRCAGDDPKEWRVHVFRRQMARNAFVPDVERYERIQAPSEKSDEQVIDFASWADAHPEFAKQLQPRFDALRKRAADAKAAIEAPRKAALERAKTSTSAFVEIPGSKEYRKAVKDGTAIVHDLPRIRSFNTDVDKPDYGKTDLPDYSVEIERAGVRTKIVVAPESFADVASRPADERSLVRDVLTTPIEGNDAASLAAVLNVFKHPHSSVSNAAYAVGYRPTFHYTKLLEGILPLYEKAAQKKSFLQDLYDVIAAKGGVIDEATVAATLKSFESESFMYTGKFGPTERKRYLRIAAALGTPDANGIYEKAPGGRGSETLYYYFHPETMRWQWSFDKQTWQRMNVLEGMDGGTKRKVDMFNEIYIRDVLPSLLDK